MSERIRLGLIFIGLILLASAIGYYVYSQRVNTSNKTASLAPIKSIEPDQVSPSPIIVFSPSPSPLSSTKASPAALAVATTKGGQSLPKTGAPEIILAAIFSTSAVIAGWSLKKFPE